MASKNVPDPDGGEGKQAKMARDTALAGKTRTSGGRGLDARSQEAIGRSLRQHYDDLVRASVPDKFVELLDLLEAKERLSKPQDGRDD